MTEAQLREVWVDAGRPGIAKLYAAARRKNLDATLANVRSFVKAQESRQIFAPGPASSGKVSSSRLDDRWQADVIDWKQMDAEKNKGMKNTLVVVDVFSRFVWAVPLPSKSPEEVTRAFRSILKVSRRTPAEVDSDGGAEFGGVFDDMLDKQGIAHRTKRTGHTNALAVVDATIKRIKETLRQEMAEDGTGNWLKFMDRAVKAINTTSHDHLMGSAPSDVKANTALQYTLQKQAGKDTQQNNKQNADKIATLRKAGAFRVLLPSKTFTRTTTARWSNEVHKVVEFIGSEVVDEKGATYPVRNTLPVATGSKQFAAPADLGSQAKQGQQRGKMERFSTVLNGFLGDEGLTLQGAGTKLRKVPGFSDAMEDAKITGIGALERFIRLFPTMFVVEGEGQKKRVKRR